ncbi:beta-beta-alpha zinc fingers domain-containing protein [Dioscorea alata]|uniref:Beta-beta-alpha zinc fingers domain-containing protein n=1 Tax=Dioscorea alata TaxID=55571 RepID=A0ACB7UJT7_DIOAL|nr:beta-beta-alpha zinc fingers domain-containing protein [Dioscorea alata]
MRSHVVMNSMVVAVEKEQEKKIRSSVGFVNGYGLRENPRKTKRFTISLRKRFEKECGESFKSLSGDMRYVAAAVAAADAAADDDEDHEQEDEEEDEQEEEEEEEEEGSWSVLSDNEVTGLVIPAKKKRSRRMSMAMEAQASSSSALEQEEQEDVAVALMMLSRDTGHWNVSESSDKNSVVDEEQQQLLVSDNNFGFKKQKMIVSDDNDSSEQCDSRKRSKYECSTCKKSFQSYQALGGHRAAHKRYPRGCLGLRIDENGIENTNSEASMDVLNTKKGKSHECLICGKCFSSGQALGGHKRSHLALSNIDAGSSDQNAVIPDLIDLNLPAPVDDESKFKNWWNCGAAVGMISN